MLNTIPNRWKPFLPSMILSIIISATYLSILILFSELPKHSPKHVPISNYLANIITENDICPVLSFLPIFLVLKSTEQL